MAVPIRLRKVPEYLQNPHLSHAHGSKGTNHSEAQELLQFPKSACVLWDGTSTGPPVFLHVAQNRKPRLQLWEKVLWLIHKQVNNEGAANRVLVGSLSLEDDAEGVSFHIDRVDTRQVDADSSLLQDDVLIPVQISNNGNQDRTGSKEDYAGAIKMLQKRCCASDTLELNNLLLVKGWCSFRSHEHSEKMIAHMQFDVVTLATVFKATPVNSVPIIPSALAKNLGGPRSLSYMQGRPKMGYLSMDATRKLLLVLESDPKVASLPVVGIWVSGVNMVHHPFVWASCLRYLHNERLQDRVCCPPEGFLVVLYTSLHSKPEFYEVCTTSGKSDLDYDLYTGYEYASLFKKSSGPEPGVIDWDLCPVRNGPKRELFDAAWEGAKMQRSDPQERGGTSRKASPSPLVSEDSMPRMMPAPHQAKAVMVRPMVPEVSMIWNDDGFPPSHTAPVSSASKPPLCLNNDSRTQNSVPFPLIAASATNHTQSVGSVPYSRNDCLAPSSVFSGSSNTNCHTVSNECMPRASFPSQYQQVHRLNSQNNHAGLQFPGTVSPTTPGFLSTAYRPNVPQSVPGPHPQNGYLNNLHFSQGPSTAAQPYAAPHPHTPGPAHGHQLHGPQPQPWSNPQLRLTAPAAVHVCRPNQPGQMATHANFPPQPWQNIQRLQQSASIPQSSSNQGQQVHWGFPVSSSHPPPHVSPSLPWSNQGAVPVDQDFKPQHSVNTHMQNSGTQNPSYVTVTHGQGDAVYSQGHQSLQQNLARMSSHQPAQNFQSNPVNTYCHPSGQSALQNPQCAAHVTAAGPVICNPRQTLQIGNDSHQSDTTSCSGKSSDDSGLSVTPDHSNPSPKPLASPMAKMETEGTSAASLEGVNWAGVPSEVVQLLVQQDAQLKMLQAQIQQLLTQRQGSAPPSSQAATPCPPSSEMSTPSTLKKETCSTAVNTTIVESPWGKASPNVQCASIQTSPLLPGQHQSAAGHHLDYSDDRFVATQRCDTHSGEGRLLTTSMPHTPNRAEILNAGETPSDVQHHGPVKMSSTEHEDGLVAEAHSVHSSANLEQPSPVRSLESHLQLSHSTPSPQSASMCVRQDDDETDNAGEISPNSKEYYDQLINNIRLFLNSHSQDIEDSKNIKDGHTDPEQDDQTRTHLQLLDSTLAASPSLLKCASGGASSNTTLMPHINYLSMMLGSEMDTSVEINAMAMKYLRDEQLTQIARHHQSPQRTGGAVSNQLLRQVLAASLDTTGTSDVSRLGMSANNMSMATRKYMEKYGLLGGGQGQSVLDVNHSIRLQTDFSLAVASESASNPSVPPSPQKMAASPLRVGAHSPVKREVFQQAYKSSPAIAEEKERSYEEKNGRRDLKDLGASPALHPPQRYHCRDQSPEDSPIFPERYRGPRGQDLINDCSLATEDDRILDIEKLKQMPKLL